MEEVLEKLRELKYLDDESFARQWARNLAVNKLWGNKKIILSLREKGIEGDLIGEGRRKSATGDFGKEAAEFLVNKKIGKKRTGVVAAKGKTKDIPKPAEERFSGGIDFAEIGKYCTRRFR